MNPKVHTADTPASPPPETSPNGDRPHPGRDPFDLERLRITATGAAVSKQLLHVPVKRPPKQAYFRVHPDEKWVIDTLCISLKEEGELYLLAGDLHDALAEEALPFRLYPYTLRGGGAGIWPVQLPGPDGRHNVWHATALQIAEMAKAQWVRCVADRQVGAYHAVLGTLIVAEPEWPDMDFQTFLRLAFKAYLIDSLSHPVVKRLLGEA
jgi:hypothetical protein